MDSAFKDKLFTSFSELQNAIQEYELQYKKVMMKINDRFYIFSYVPSYLGPSCQRADVPYSSVEFRIHK